MKKLLFFVLLYSICFFALPKTNALASVLFYDDFDQGKTSGWEESYGFLGSWNVVNGEYVGNVAKGTSDFPTYSLNGNQDWTNYRFKVKIRGDIGVDKVILFRFNSFNKTYAIKLCSTWPDTYGDKVILHKNNLIGITNSATYVNKIGIWYNLEVQVRDNNIKLFIDGSIVPVIDYQDDDFPSLSGKIGLLVWPGGYGGYLTQNSFDDVLVCDFNGPCEMPTPTPTNLPSPTPTPTIDPNTEKTVFLPGMSASWNADALLNCKTEGYSGTWTMGPYANLFYDPLYRALSNQIIPYYYDWREDVRSHTVNLKRFIESLGENKVNLIGHSMGGLVIRAYLEETKELSKVDRLMTLGTPHRGVVQAYPTWSAGEIVEDNLILKFVETLLLKRCGTNSKNSREIVRNVIPSSQNLLPTFDFLKNKKSEEIKPISLMDSQSNWNLSNLNPGFWGVKFGTLSGNSFLTPRYLLTKNPSSHDLNLGNWIDGKVIKQEKSTEGDGTVLLQSSQIPNATNIVINQNHTGLVNTIEAINEIKNFLGITIKNVSSDIPVSPEIKSALIIMSYPSTFSLTDQYNKHQEDRNGLVFIPNPQKMKYKIEIKPKSENTLFIVAQFLKNGQIYWKEYNLYNKVPKKGFIDFNLLQPKEDILKLEP